MKKWSVDWLVSATVRQLRKARAQARHNVEYLSSINSPRLWFWEVRATDVEFQLDYRGVAYE